MSEPVCPDCGAAMRPAGDAWYCHACLGASGERDTDDETDDHDGRTEPTRRGLAGELARADVEVFGDE